MKMRSISRFFMGMLAVCTIAACSDDLGNGSNVNPDASKDAVYMNVTVQLPVAGGGSRSQTGASDNDYGTSTDGTEVGKDYENAVKSVLLVLAKTKENGNENEIIAFGTNDKPTTTGATIVSTHSIKKATLAKYYEGKSEPLNDNQSKIKVYIFCNPTSNLINIISNATDNTWVNEVAEITEDVSTVTKTIGGTDGAAIWGGSDNKGGFLMSTACAADIEKNLPLKMEYWDQHDTPLKAFDLSGTNSYASSDHNINNSTSNNGSIRVERSVARFDFKDGSKGDNTYTGVVKNDKDDNLINIQLTKMALVNMSKKFYYLRRVSDDGLNTNNTLCGTETSKNYVVDTDAADKQGSMNEFTFADHFNFCLGHGENGTKGHWTIDETARNQWYIRDIKDILGENKKPDNDEEWNNPSTQYGDYYIWRYVTENTIPTPKPGGVAQRNGISTGIVFKGKMLVADKNATDAVTTAIKNATGDSDTDPILYAYGNNLFVRWKEVHNYALTAGDNVLYKRVFGTPKNNTPAAITDDNIKTGTIYSDDDKSPDYLWNQWYNTYINNDNPEELKNTQAAKDALKLFKEAATKDAKFTLYQSSKESDTEKGYYCYYYYWNRHNDNEKDAEMGPMEFAVVRNNVYKLAVTEISKLGHPRISENDPDPVDPEDPDESGDVYIKLSVKVLPWVVRINNIKF